MAETFKRCRLAANAPKAASPLTTPQPPLVKPFCFQTLQGKEEHHSVLAGCGTRPFVQFVFRPAFILMRLLPAAFPLLGAFLSFILYSINAFDDSSSFTIEFSEPLSDPVPPSSCDAPPPNDYTSIPPPVGNAIRDVDRGPGDPPLSSTQHRFADADGATAVPYQFNTSSRYTNLSIHEVVGHVHSRSGFDVVVLEMNRLTTGVSTSIRPEEYFDGGEREYYPNASARTQTLQGK